jgi:non-homologous end joining protein Ku
MAPRANWKGFLRLSLVTCRSVSGYFDRDTYVEITKEELENIAVESTRTIDIDEFVAKDQIDPRYIIRPYYLSPGRQCRSRRLRCHPRDHP